MSELKPCPFCGGEAKLMHNVVWHQDEKERTALVQCRNCKAKTQEYLQLAYQTLDVAERYAVRDWNHRVGGADE